jgi:hypothetical protein
MAYRAAKSRHNKAEQRRFGFPIYGIAMSSEQAGDTKAAKAE